MQMLYPDFAWPFIDNLSPCSKNSWKSFKTVYRSGYDEKLFCFGDLYVYYFVYRHFSAILRLTCDWE